MKRTEPRPYFHKLRTLFHGTVAQVGNGMTFAQAGKVLGTDLRSYLLRYSGVPRTILASVHSLTEQSYWDLSKATGRRSC